MSIRILHPTKATIAENVATIRRGLARFKARGEITRYGGGLDDVVLAKEAIEALNCLEAYMKLSQPSLL